MQTILKQRRLFVTKEFELDRGVLIVKERRPFRHFESRIGFEVITATLVRKKPFYLMIVFTILVFLKFAGAIYFQFPVETVFDGFAFIVCFIITLVTYRNNIYILLTNGVPLSFFAKSPDKAQLKTFIELLLAERKSYLFDRYTARDTNLTEEQRLANLNWLYKMNVISKNELQELKR